MRDPVSLLEKHAKEISLHEEEKQYMRASLVEYLGYAPVRIPTSKKPFSSRLFSGHLFYPFSLSHLNTYYLRGALLIALIVTGGTMSVTSAATSALPGDFLYPVKIRVNEEVRTVFMSSDEARVAWERERAEMRMREASTLVATGKLSEKAQEVLEKQLAIHTDTFIAQVRVTASHDPVLASEMSDDFADSMEAHEAVLTRLIVEQHETIPSETRTFVKNVHTATQQGLEVDEIAIANVNTAISIPPEETISEITGASVFDTGAGEDPEPASTASMLVNAPTERIDARAAYRAKQHAEEQYTQAQALMDTLESNTQMLASARMQIDSAHLHIEEGVQALTDGQMVLAYNAYRTAGTRLKKVVEVLHATRLFSVQIADDILSDVAHVSAEGKRSRVSRISTLEEVSLLHMETNKNIDEARHLLLSYEGYGSAISGRAHNHIKQSLTYVLRSEIALVLDDMRSAHTHVENAEKHAKKSLEILNASLESPSVTRLYDTTVNETPVATASTSPMSTSLSITHIFEENIHHYTGEIPFTADCVVVRADIVLGEGDSPEMRLVLEVSESFEIGTDCEMIATGTKAFIATSSAPSEMVLTEVTLNGEPVTWTVYEPTTEDTPFTTATSGLEVVEYKEESTLFRKAIESARTLFSD